MRKGMVSAFLSVSWSLCAAAPTSTWNHPHLPHPTKKVLFSAFAGAPKTLDPARSYSSDEWRFITQIVEPPLQYHYLKRPHELEPLTATSLPSVTWYNAQHQPVPKSTPLAGVAYSVYDIYLQPGLYYAPHPAFARHNGRYRYVPMPAGVLASKKRISDFQFQGTRELTAADYVYQIKRLASPKVQSPIFSLMSKHIVGLAALGQELQHVVRQRKTQSASTSFLDLRRYPLLGARVISRYHYQIKIKGVYPPFLYWLAMPFFAPTAWEADRFYSQPGMKARHFSFDWIPVGTGPYQLSENNPNQQMILDKNPRYRPDTYPEEGAPQDKENGYLSAAGQSIPFIDRHVFSLEKESIPRWNKFLQGYYDTSGISRDSFDQAVTLNDVGQAELTPALKQKGLRLQTQVEPGIFYIGFNMLDPTVGGTSDRARYLRQAISIAIDYEEYITLFLNGRGMVAHGPIPPGIFGYRAGKEGINQVVYQWKDGKAQRRPIAQAKALMIKAGYPGGIDPKTQQPLILNYDVSSLGGADDKARFNWYRKQFLKLGIALEVRATQYNRFQDKVRRGNAQIFSWGWMADYPDPENFLFLLHGPNAKVKHGGENAANYQNSNVDRLFDVIKNQTNGPERARLIQTAVKKVQHDAPWVWGVHPIYFHLSHSWNAPSKPNAMARNTLKYQNLNSQQRRERQRLWNAPVVWPVVVLALLLLFILLPLGVLYWRRQNQSPTKRQKE